jgi:hypothetical protein
MARDESSIGRVGVLTVATRGKAGPGEVHVKIRGGSESFLAWSDRPLPRGATVLVTESRGGRVVDVIEWDDVLGDAPRTALSSPAHPRRAPCSATVFRPPTRPC